MDTAGLIEELAAHAGPVRPLPRPSMRAVLWLAIAVPSVAIVVAWMSPRPDLSLQFSDPRFLVEEAAALATAVLAAVAAFSCTVPGRSRAVCALPMLPLAVWLASVGNGCIQDWLTLGPEGLRLRLDTDCVPAAALVGIVPGIAMVAMLRRGAPLYPRTTLAMGALAVGSLANAGMQLYHEGDVSIMVLVWHLGSVAVLSAAAAGIARHVLRWTAAEAFAGSPARPIGT
jgi:hypothetical protein